MVIFLVFRLLPIKPELIHMNLLRGQRVKLSDLISYSLPFTIKVVVNMPKLSIDFCCFGLDMNNKLLDERYMSFFNQPETPCGAVRFGSCFNNTAVFVINLQKLPVHIDRLIITAAIDGDGTMSQLASGAVTLHQNNIEAATFAFSGNDFSAERALMLMEIYRKDGSWRACATGQGFNGGLDVLVRYFGGTIAESPVIAQEAVEQLFTQFAMKQEHLDQLSIQHEITQKSVERSTGLTSKGFLQRLFRPLFPDNTSTNNKNDSNLSGYWKPQGTSVKVFDIVIEGGFLYFGSELCSIGSPSQTEPALVNPNLPVGTLISANYQQRLLSYWSSYSEATPDARAAYIKWLMGGRNDPLSDIGYVFLYFYGLERRALADAKTDMIAKAELPKIIQEIERLVEIYHNHDYGSFGRYAIGLLELLKLDCPKTFAPKQYLNPPPDFKSGSWTFPLALKLVLGQLAMDNEPVPADWAYAWLIADPALRLRTPATRCAVEFKQSFITKYRESFGNGMRLPVNKTKIKVSYHTASASFFSNRTIERKLDIPDVTVLSSRTKKLQALADQCSGSLNAYSRFLGRSPELAGTLDALLELPYSLWTEPQKKYLQAIKYTLETSSVPVAITFTQLKTRLPEWQTITKSRVVAFITRLAEAGLGMEPDPRFGGTVPNIDTKVVLFIDESSLCNPTPRYATAALTLHLAVVVSMADGMVDRVERDLLIQQVEDWLHLEPIEKNRLHAHLCLLLSGKPDLKSIKKRVGRLPVSAREVLANFLVQVACADNTVSPNKIKILEKIYKVLNLDVQSLYGKLHGADTDEPVTVRPPQPKSSGFSIPNFPKPDTGFQLDMSRVAALKNESQKVTDMLVAIFEQDVIPENLIPIQIQSNNENLLGLDNAHSDLIKLLYSRVQWSRSELEEIAAEGDMMLDGALEHINEAAYDSFDEPFTEGDDPININQDILKELLCDNDTSER